MNGGDKGAGQDRGGNLRLTVERPSLIAGLNAAPALA